MSALETVVPGAAPGTVPDTIASTGQDQFSGPDVHGHFGQYGGVFVGETLMAAVEELDQVYRKLSKEPSFWQAFDHDMKHYVGRPSPLYYAERLSKQFGGAKIVLKREDLNHTGAHKINNTIGQALLAKYMGKPRIIAETGAGQHGVASATVAARLGLECHVYMGAEDVQRQSANVYRMKLMGANVIPVTSGSRTLKDALNEALRDWATNVDNTLLPSSAPVAGPHTVSHAGTRLPGHYWPRGTCTVTAGVRPTAPMRWWRVWAVVPMRSGCSILFCATLTWPSMVWKRAVMGLKPAVMRRRYLPVNLVCYTATVLM